MRVSDWSSDVCSSDLRRCIGPYVRPYALLRLPLRAAPARHQAASFAPPSRPGSRPLACRHDGRTDRIGSCSGALGSTAAVRHIDTHRPRHSFGDTSPPVRLSATLPTGLRDARPAPPRTLDLHATLVLPPSHPPPTPSRTQPLKAPPPPH